MFRKLVSRNADLQRLLDKGYAVTADGGFLVVRDIPYLDAGGLARVGAFVTKLVFLDQDRVIQEDHQVFFAGGVPHQLDGRPVPNLGDRPASLALSNRSHDVVVERVFSNKPRMEQCYEDFFAKIESYTALISGPAIERFGVSPYTFRRVPDVDEASVFKFQDTLTSRAEIVDLSAKFESDVVAVIGLGGTGSYLLDFLVKTAVKEIRGFDADDFLVHNAYRSPGRLDPDEFGKKKADVYRSRYDSFRSGLRLAATYIDTTSADELEGVTFAFVCVDKGSSRAEIFKLLISKGIPFIDVGMGLVRKPDGLTGMARVTYYSPERAERMLQLQLAEMTDTPENVYRTNVQISELNAMNAALAIFRFKQLRGFYRTERSLAHLLFSFGTLGIIGEDDFDEV